jgi:hypothetical protein
MSLLSLVALLRYLHLMAIVTSILSLQLSVVVAVGCGCLRYGIIRVDFEVDTGALIEALHLRTGPPIQALPTVAYFV